MRRLLNSAFEESLVRKNDFFGLEAILDLDLLETVLKSSNLRQSPFFGLRVTPFTRKMGLLLRQVQLLQKRKVRKAMLLLVPFWGVIQISVRCLLNTVSKQSTFDTKIILFKFLTSKYGEFHQCIFMGSWDFVAPGSFERTALCSCEKYSYASRAQLLLWAEFVY